MHTFMFQRIHDRSGVFHCPKCPFKHESKQAFDTHERHSHRTCPHCHKVFVFLDRHVDTCPKKWSVSTQSSERSYRGLSWNILHQRTKNVNKSMGALRIRDLQDLLKWQYKSVNSFRDWSEQFRKPWTMIGQPFWLHWKSVKIYRVENNGWRKWSTQNASWIWWFTIWTESSRTMRRWGQNSNPSDFGCCIWNIYVIWSFTHCRAHTIFIESPVGQGVQNKTFQAAFQTTTVQRN